MRRGEFSIKFRLISKDGFPVISLPDGYDLVEVFIGTELQANDEDGKWIIEAINAVIDGEVEHIWLQAKYLTLNLNSQETRIIDPYADDCKNECVISTTELKTILLDWISVRDQYYLSQ
ncbi:hypothetical protein AV654_32620 [Paenibacillus elgii]|uniref:Uncharacterized protein n=1 Tax=Paenibacillus elgii TaxID=189691 RepID=A0A165Q2A7_9BACL|nr:hypothetical protein [Paenibacillus elgii]KZE73422.1 hypothetical protein AV654_32620 [Paenibacillus elgii]